MRRIVSLILDLSWPVTWSISSDCPYPCWPCCPYPCLDGLMQSKWWAYPGFCIFSKTFPYATFFKKDSIILPSIWGYKFHSIAKAHIKKKIKKGGLGLPILKHYYWVANSRAFVYWNCKEAETENIPSWLQLKASAVKSSSQPALLFSGPAAVDFRKT